jgi:hypothetical protein
MMDLLSSGNYYVITICIYKISHILSYQDYLDAEDPDQAIEDVYHPKHNRFVLTALSLQLISDACV